MAISPDDAPFASDFNGLAANDAGEPRRMPPENLDAERSIIGNLLYEGARITEVVGTLRPEQFYSEQHRRIFDACITLHQGGRGISTVTVADAMRSAGTIGVLEYGVSTLAEIVADTAVLIPRLLADHVRLVVDAWRARQAIVVAQRVLAVGYAGGDTEQLIASAVESLVALRDSRATHDPEDGPTTSDPLHGLAHLSKVAVVGRARIRELAAQPPRFVWSQIAVAGTIVLLASGPGEGKTTLLFLILVARLNLADPVHVLGRAIEPAPAGRFAVLIEGEHSESSSSRKLLRSIRLLAVDEAALDRIIVVARKAVRLGSPEWDDVVTLVRSGLVSDIAIDTVARVAPGDGNDEREQVAIFDVVAQAIEAAPNEDAKPTVWAAAHTRKNGRTGDVSDVAGSVQRTGQADSVLMLEGQKVEGRTVATKVVFGKLREEPDDYPLPVTFSIIGDEVVTSVARDDDERPVEARLLDQLKSGPKTKNALATALGRSGADIETALTNLFTARRIETTSTQVRGKPCKAFRTRNLARLSPDSMSPDFSPDVDQTDS